MMTQTDFPLENIDELFQQGIDEAIEEHRVNGIAIAQSDDNGNVIIIQPENITPLAEKIKQRQEQSVHQN